MQKEKILNFYTNICASLARCSFPIIDGQSLIGYVNKNPYRLEIVQIIESVSEKDSEKEQTHQPEKLFLPISKLYRYLWEETKSFRN